MHPPRPLRTPAHCSYPLKCPETAIAPDLLESAGEAGIDTSEFGDDVAAFLQGGVRA